MSSVSKMFCYQCQEAAKNIACVSKGVCGKSDELSSYMDYFKYLLKLMAKETCEAKKGSKDKKHFIMDGLFKLITNANFDKKIFLEEIQKAVNYINEARVVLEKKPLTFDENKITNEWQIVGTLAEQNEDLRGIKELIITGLMGIAAYHSHAIRLGFEDNDLHCFTIGTLGKINECKDINTLLQLVDECGKNGVKAMKLLDEANTSTFGNPVATKVNIGVKNNPGILISGHDLADIKELLEQSKDSGVDIYTHCEMLPAHYYPELKKYHHLVGNYGGSWWKQCQEFETFNGPVVFTTNCIVPPLKNASYKDRVYTTNNAGYDCFKHIPLKNGKKDFSKVIEQAKECKPPEEIENGEIIGGFAHNQVLSLADKIVENIKNSSIKKFIVMGGCDGRHGSRNYYEDFAKKLPKDTIILTAGCAKFRYNKLNLGDINSIPRVLDAGQCNDSYSLVVIALKLKEAFNLENLNDLPLSFNLAWYEQKAVIVLLSLLHLGVKNIKLGPTLPAFVTQNIADILVKNYGISTINSVENDLLEMA